LAAFEVIMYGRFSGDYRGLHANQVTQVAMESTGLTGAGLAGTRGLDRGDAVTQYGTAEGTEKGGAAKAARCGVMVFYGAELGKRSIAALALDPLPDSKVQCGPPQSAALDKHNTQLAPASRTFHEIAAANLGKRSRAPKKGLLKCPQKSPTSWSRIKRRDVRGQLLSHTKRQSSNYLQVDT
jgi:hypothetical protein